MAEPPSTAAPPGRRWRIIVLKTIVFAAVLAFVGNTLRTALADLQKTDWRIDRAALIFSGLVYLAGLLPAGIFWYYLLGKLGQRVAVLDAMRAYFVGHLGKYVPGKAMVVVLRAGIAKSAGADAALAAIAVVVETLTMMACGSAVAFVLVATTLPPDWKLALAAGLAIATGGPTLPPLLNRLLRRMHQRETGRSPELETAEETILEEAVMEEAEIANEPPVAADAAMIQWRLMATGWAAMLLVWILLGLSLAVLLSGLDEGAWSGFRPFVLAIAAVALATVAGFLSLLPGGLIVRELILLDLLAPEVGEATALVAAVLLRLVWLVSELAASGALVVASWIRK